MILIAAYMPSKAGWNRGKTKPPRPSPANATPSRAAVSISERGRVRDRTTSMPKRAAIFSMFRDAVTGTPTSPCRACRQASRQTTCSATSSGSGSPFSSTRKIFSPPVSSITPRSAFRERAIVARWRIPLSNSSRVLVAWDGSRMAFRATASTPSRPRIRGKMTDEEP